jgi:hypothetical protein
MRHALVLLALAAACTLLAGWWLSAAGHVTYWTGAYWALAAAATVGYLTPTRAALLPMTAVMLTDIPLLLAVFGLATSARIRRHHRADLAEQDERLKAHIAGELAAHREALARHISALPRESRPPGAGGT